MTHYLEAFSHHADNYSFAVSQYKATGDEEYLELAESARDHMQGIIDRERGESFLGRWNNLKERTS